jgi:hydroxyethylthiazole kinase-like uncharacterized protein yjeF
MTGPNSQILSVAQMRAAEAALVDAGTGVDALMQRAGRGAAEWVYRMAWPRAVTVLCGPGNNGGDGYVIAEALRERGLEVAVVAPLEPGTAAAKNARAAWRGPVLERSGGRHGGTLVDCLFGSGLTRPLSDGLLGLLQELAGSHPHRVSVDLPSGVESDSGLPLNDGLPEYDLTIALGAWKYAHWLMPSAARMGMRQLVPIGVGEVPRAAQLLARPQLTAPAADAHKYRRGLLVVAAGAMPGASLLACAAALHCGAGYVKLASADPPAEMPPDLVVEAEALGDPRANGLLVGPGLGRGDAAKARLADALARNLPIVFDADALAMLKPEALAGHSAARIATPHEGELAALAKAFGIEAESKLAIARELAAKAGMVVVAKGPDTVITAPDGRTTIAPPAPSWLSTAGTGDVLAGLIASRLATGAGAFVSACEGVWLHGEAARLAGMAFSAGDLIHNIPTAYSTVL